MSSSKLDSPYSASCGQDSYDFNDDQEDQDDGDEDSDEGKKINQQSLFPFPKKVTESEEKIKGVHIKSEVTRGRSHKMFATIGALVSLIGSTSVADTEDASETEIGKSEEYTEIKEQMYQDKLANLKKQLQQLKDGTHPEYNRLNKKLEQEYKDRLTLNSVSKAYLIDRVERDFINEMKAAAKEYKEKKIELKENLIVEYEEKKKMIETERHSLELLGDSMEVKPVMTRKLRRRPNDPVPVPEKRRKPPPAQLNYLLDEKEIELDLKIISRGRSLPPQIRRVPLPGNLGVPSPVSQNDSSCHEPRIEDGKLRYEKRFFHRGQPVFVEGKDIPRFAANIHNIGTDVVR